MFLPSPQWPAFPPRRQQESSHRAYPRSSRQTPLPAESGIRLQFIEEKRSNKKSLNNVCLGLVWSNKSSLILDRTPTHTDIDSAEGLPWMFSSCSSKWSRWRWSMCRRHSWSSSLASKPWKIWTWQIFYILPQCPFTNSFSQRFGTLVSYLWIAHNKIILLPHNQQDNQ